MARRGYRRSGSRGHKSAALFGYFFRKRPGKSKVDTRKQLGEKLEPFARFDSDIERFCCRKCGYQAETYRGIDAHIAECYP
jgi:hypothetical protein